MFAKTEIIKIHLARQNMITEKEFIPPHSLFTPDLSHIAQLSSVIFWFDHYCLRQHLNVSTREGRCPL